MGKSVLRTIALTIGSFLSISGLLTAACVSGSAPARCLQFEWKTSGNTDRFTNAPTAAQQDWLRSHMSRINGREGAVLSAYLPSNGPLPDGDYVLTNLATRLVLDDPGGLRNVATQMTPWLGATDCRNPLWHFASQGNGFYTIQNQASRHFLTPYAGSGSMLQQLAPTGSDKQLWSLQPSGAGSVIVNKANGLAIEVPQIPNRRTAAPSCCLLMQVRTRAGRFTSTCYGE